MTDEPIIDKLERLEREATPGEWEALKGVGSHLLLRVVTPNMPGNTQVYLGSMTSYADAELAALAPALLSQLREALDVIVTAEGYTEYLQAEGTLSPWKRRSEALHPTWVEAVSKVTRSLDAEADAEALRWGTGG